MLNVNFTPLYICYLRRQRLQQRMMYAIVFLFHRENFKLYNFKPFNPVSMISRENGSVSVWLASINTNL